MARVRLSYTTTLLSAVASAAFATASISATNPVVSHIAAGTATFSYDLVPMEHKHDSVSPTDSVTTIEVTKVSGDTVTPLEASVFSTTLNRVSTTGVSDSAPVFTSTLGKTESVSPSDASVLNPQLVKTDSVSPSDSPVLNPQLVKTDSVTMSDTRNKVFTATVDFDVSDSDVDPDPVAVADAPVFTVTAKPSDTVSMSDSVETNYQPGDTVAMYPDSVIISDGDIGGFIVRATEPYTGVLGAPGYLGQVILNDDKITSGDNTNSGLTFQFVYTETMIGAHELNETPIA
tara:strand:- start:1610 stop:2476 length:867 start_codon:yes stop_codon:yes gene_type:complete